MSTPTNGTARERMAEVTGKIVAALIKSSGALESVSIFKSYTPPLWEFRIETKDHAGVRHGYVQCVTVLQLGLLEDKDVNDFVQDMVGRLNRHVTQAGR